MANRDPALDQQLLSAAKAYYDQNDLQGAQTMVSDVLHKTSDKIARANAYQLAALICMKKGDLFAAKNQVALSIKLHHSPPAMFYHNAAEIYRQNKEYLSALDLCKKALMRADGWQKELLSAIHVTTGNIMQDMKSFIEAERCYLLGLEWKGCDAAVWSNLGNALKGQGKIIPAINAHVNCIHRKPDFAPAYANLASIHQMEGDYEKARHYNVMALERDPTCAQAHFGIGLGALVKGDLQTGWELYEWRWRATNNNKEYLWEKWEGQDWNCRLLVHHEQGLGDSLMFCRYLPLLVESGIDVTFGVTKELRRIMERSFPRVKMLESGAIKSSSFDYQIPLMGLPRIFQTELGTIPIATSYLVSKRREDVAANNDFIVGFCHRGNPEHANDKNRSMSFDQLEPLMQLEGVCPVGLDYAALKAIYGVKDVSDTAEIIMALDLVITVDTSVAHLAGALGKPVWLLLPRVPDWRWLDGVAEKWENKSPWYPSMVIFRQEQAGDWTPVLMKVADCLANIANCNQAVMNIKNYE